MSAAADVAAELRGRIAELAAELVGSPPTSRSRHEARFYPRGGLAVDLRRGLWCDHASGQGGDALDLVRHVRGGTAAEALGWAKAWLGQGTGRQTILRQVDAVSRKADAKLGQADDGASRRARQDLARRLWVESLPAPGTLVELYLRGRGLQLPPDHAGVLRFHPSCPRGEGERHPAMLALMRDSATGEPCGTHRTFLRPDGAGKADGQSKAMLGGAGVVHLVDAAEVTLGLGLAEGVETSLAIMQHAGWRPVWAAGSAGGIARFPALPGVEALVVFGDSDDGGAGVQAARQCAGRWADAGRHVTIELPPAGEDWADVAARVAA